MEVELSTWNFIKVVAASSLVTWCLNWWIGRVATQRSATYSAIRLAVTLEQFSNSCVSALSDHSFAVESSMIPRGIALPTLLSYPSDVDWKVLPVTMSEPALRFQNELEESRRAISYMHVIEGERVYDTAIKETVKRGMEALELATRFRTKYGLPALSEGQASVELMQNELLTVSERERTLYLTLGF